MLTHRGFFGVGFPSCCILWVLTPKGSKQGPPQDTLDQATPFPPTLYPAPKQLVGFAFPRKKTHRQIAGEAEQTKPVHFHPCTVVAAADAQNQPTK